MVTVTQVHAKKLKIHRCVLENGTILFQEKKCDKQDQQKAPAKPQSKTSQIKHQPSISSNSKNQTVKIKPQSIFAKPNEIAYSKIANVALDDNSTSLISDRVKLYNISMQGLKKWALFKKVYNNKLLHIKILDEQLGEEISLRIDFIFPDNKRFSEAELSELVYLVGSQYVATSIEGEITPAKMRISNGKGIKATFTHANDDVKYRYTTRGAVYKGKWLIQFTLLSSNINSFSFRYAVQNLFDSIQISQ